MFCPNCGAENQDDLSYCRSCGNDLKIISQVMKKHLSVALVSKLDAVIEQKNERLRRDAILYALMGAVCLILSVFTPFAGDFISNVVLSLFGIIAIFYGGFNFLAYRRRLELKEKSVNLLISGETLSSDISQIESLSKSREISTNKLNAVSDSQSVVGLIYCPRCGLQNLEDVLYCRACGTHLDFSSRPQGMERYLPSFIVNKLDTKIAKNENTDYKFGYKSGWTLLIIVFLYLFVIVLQGIDGHWGMAGFYFVNGFLIIVSLGWNLIASRRNLEKDKQFLDTAVDLPTKELLFQDGLDTLQLESSPPPPLSIAESTTKKLDPVIKQIEQEEILKTRKLESQND